MILGEYLYSEKTFTFHECLYLLNMFKIIINNYDVYLILEKYNNDIFS
jgi:hypothetical protein